MAQRFHHPAPNGWPGRRYIRPLTAEERGLMNGTGRPDGARRGKELEDRTELGPRKKQEDRIGLGCREDGQCNEERRTPKLDY